MKVLAISDLHGMLPSVDPCDVLVIAGDVCPLDDHSVPRQADFLNVTFAQWLDDIPATHVVGIAGNHDFVYDRSPHLVSDRLRWTYLKDQAATVAGLRVYGTPWCPRYRDWAFNLDEARLAERFAGIPDGLDILIAHTPPRDYGDRVKDGRRVGSTALADRVRTAAPRYLVVGHIHEARGDYRMPTNDGRTTTVLNVSQLDVRYAPTHGPVEIDVNRDDPSAVL